jgi:hypothetical protein
MSYAIGIRPARIWFVNGLIAVQHVRPIDECRAKLARYTLVVKPENFETWDDKALISSFDVEQ